MSYEESEGYDTRAAELQTQLQSHLPEKLARIELFASVVVMRDLRGTRLSPVRTCRRPLIRPFIRGALFVRAASSKWSTKQPTTRPHLPPRQENWRYKTRGQTKILII